MNKFFNNLGLTAGFCMVAIVIAVMLAPPQVLSQAVGSSGYLSVIQTGLFDPCESPNAAKISVPIAVTTAANTELFVPVAGKTVFFCSAKVSVAGAQQITFSSETATGCAGLSAKTGAYNFAAASNPIELLTPPLNAFQSPKSGGVCMVTGQAVSTQGIAIAVQF